MVIFLLKSAACLGIFYAFYKAFLERENMHQIKRFYLLGSVVASFLIPLVTFTKYIEVKTTMIPITTSEFMTEMPTVAEIAPNYWPTVVWSIYLLGVLFFSLKFGRNLYSMIQKIRRNPLFKNDSIFHVLLKTPTTPHTFFSYVFLNKRKFEAHEIPEEVLLHEQAHAKELHSLDVILIELLQIVFWFNPFVYFFKHSIKLNHEFLADRAVLNKGVETASYQTILLAFSSNATAPELANSINYSFIKKRFTVMKTSTSKRTVWLRSLVLLPLLALLIYGFSSTQIALKESASFSEETIEKATPKEIQQYNTLASFWNNRFEEDPTNRVMPLSELKKLETIYQRMNVAQRNDAQPFPDCGIQQEKDITAIPTARSIEIQIEENGTYLVEGISATKNTLAQVVGRLHQDLTPAIRNHMMNIHITNPKGPSREEVQFIFDNLKAYGFYRLVAGNQEVVRGKGNTPMAPVGQILVKATKEQIKEYNKLAKKYNNMPKDNMRINGKEITRMRYIYDLMTIEQRKDAEPFPNIPPPPPPPAPGMADAPPPIEVIIGVNDGDANIPPPPPPPAPEDPLDHVIGMAKKGATFYYEGKKITSDKAIELLKKHKDLNIESTGKDTKNPVVKITKAPIQIKKGKSVAFETGNTRSVGGGEQLFYARAGDKTTYYNRYGTTVNIKGEPITNLNKNPFFYNGESISPQKANQLLQNNKSLSTSARKNIDGSYSLILNSSTSNAAKYNYNNINNTNSNSTGNTDPSAFKQLEDAINEGATFFYNDKLISTAVALDLIKDPLGIARMNKVTPKAGKPIVYLYQNSGQGVANGPTQDPQFAFKNTLEKGDAFFLKDKEISKKEALLLFKEKPSIRIKSVNSSDGTIKVYLNDDNC